MFKFKVGDQYDSIEKFEKPFRLWKDYELIDKEMRNHFKKCVENSQIDLFPYNQKRSLRQIPNYYPLVLID